MLLPRNRRDGDLSVLQPVPVVPAEGAGLTSLVVGVTIVVTLYLAREVLVPIALAILLSFMLAPVVRLIRRTNLPRTPAVVLSVFLALGLILSLGGLIGMQITDLVNDLPRYANTIEQKVAGVRGIMVGEVAGRLGWLGKQIEQASSEPVRPAATTPGPSGIAEP